MLELAELPEDIVELVELPEDVIGLPTVEVTDDDGLLAWLGSGATNSGPPTEVNLVVFPS